MRTRKISTNLLAKTLAVAAFMALSSASFAENTNWIIDDFSNPSNSSLNTPRQFINDSIAGGKSIAHHDISAGIMSVNGEISPPRGQPGWASTVLLLTPKGEPVDKSTFKGIRLLVRINAGNLSLSANSTDVTNFDYHAAPVAVVSDGQFHEVKIPFNSMKRAWSEQTALNTKTLNGLSIVAYDLQKGSFDYAIDEVSFY